MAPRRSSLAQGPWQAQGWRSQAARWIEAIVFMPVAVLAVIT
jgi:hypothetical protein